MPLTLFAHPFSSYCQKVLIALYENATPFEYRTLDDDGSAIRELAERWPMKRFPILLYGERMVFEATSIIEHVGVHYPGRVPMLPSDPAAATEVRMLDRFFDNYVSTPQQKVVFDAIRPEAERDARGVRDAFATLDTAYAWLERHMAGRTWAAGEGFSLADCGAAPFLFYADWTHPIGDRFPQVSAYRKRLLARPSVARCVDEARPYRKFFPLGAPDRD